MNTSLEFFLERTYRFLLRAYPPAFRKRFAQEMIQVYHSLTRQVYQETGSSGLLRLWLAAVWDMAFGVLLQWWQHLTQQRIVNMNADPLEKTDGTIPLNIRQTILAVLPFLLFGISSLADRLEILHVNPSSLTIWRAMLVQPYLVFNWIILLGLAAGIIAGFPRWTFSYLGWALLVGWWWTGMGFYGYHWKWQIWVPFVGIIALSVLIRRSLQPLWTILASLWRDLTLFAFGVYILYTFMYILADENHNPYLLLLISLSTLAACLGAWGFFRTASPMRRVLALIGGFFLATILGIIDSLTWDYREYYNLPDGPSGFNFIGVMFFIILAAVMLGLGWLTHRAQNKRKLHSG